MYYKISEVFKLESVQKIIKIAIFGFILRSANTRMQKSRNVNHMLSDSGDKDDGFFEV